MASRTVDGMVVVLTGANGDIGLQMLRALAEKAQDLHKLAETDYGLERQSIPNLLQRNIETVGENYPSVSFAVTVPDDLTILAYPSLEIAILELLENAAKHGGDSPTCTVTAEESADGISIEINDDGPGMSDHDRQVLEGEPETALSHGIGIGLWIVWWAIDSHDGTIEITVSEAGTSIRVTILHPELNRKLRTTETEGQGSE